MYKHFSLTFYFIAIHKKLVVFLLFLQAGSKHLRRMKWKPSHKAKTLLFIPLLLLAMHASLSVYAQNIHQKITLQFNNIPLADAFSQLQTQSGVRFTFSPALLQAYTTGNIPRAEKTVSEWVALLLHNRPFVYQYISGQIVITPQQQQAPQVKDTVIYYTVSGYIRDSIGFPIEGASVQLQDVQRGQITDSNGHFSITRITPGKTLQVNAIGYLPYHRVINGNGVLQILLQRIDNKPLDTVAVSTGYQQLNKDRTTGSFAVMDNQLVNRNILPNILDRLEGMMSSMQFIKNIPFGSGANEGTLSVRGRSTINSSPQPLIIMDNFPFDGDLANINPNDIESVTLLKDAASASIWGALSGNGVIVFTTKKGHYFQKPQVKLFTNYTLSEQPDLYYSPALAPADYIEIETFLMNNGHYNNIAPSTVLSPAVEIMVRTKKGLLSSLDSAKEMQQLTTTDTRTDLDKYYYRKGFNQQYSLSVAGGTSHDNYYVSASFNKKQQELKRNGIDRYTFYAANSIRIPKTNLEIYTAASLSQSLTKANNDNSPMPWPYLALAHSNKQALTIPFGYGRMYTDTAGGGKLIDWKFRPLDQLNNANNTDRLNEGRLNFQARYLLIKGLQLSASYQYSTSNKRTRNYYSLAMFEARNLINTYSQINPANGAVSNPIPKDGIMNEAISNLNSHNTRLMAQYQQTFGKEHSLFSIAGYDIRMMDALITSIRKYGYNYTTQKEIPVDYTIAYRNYVTGTASTIPFINSRQQLNNNFLSWFISNNYTFRNRYFASASLRRDESNLFGANINNKGVPLWSAGLGWLISNEKFYPRNYWLEELKLRATMGYTGNVNTRLSAFTTALRTKITNRFGSFSGTVTNPANANLGWEKVRIINLGVDFSMLQKRIYGSFEFYQKDGSDLIGPATADPTTGFSTYTGNAASTEARGIDLSLNVIPVKGNIQWNIAILLSYNNDKVKKYTRKQPSVANYLTPIELNPVEGKPLYSLYSLPYLGLNDQGNPVGVLNGARSTDYINIYNSQNIQNIHYQGPTNPTTFGSVIHNISWKQFSLSLFFTFKTGYFFRKPGLNYSSIIADNSAGHPEYRQRWQKPGDENFTNIPALIYPFDGNRDDFYKVSDELVERGDHIRLQDIKLTWQPSRKKFTIYTYVNNVRILWRANRSGIDPDYVPHGSAHVWVFPALLSCTTGINYNF